MQSKNKPSMSKAEREHVGRIKEMPCGVCDASGPSDAHGWQRARLSLWLALSRIPEQPQQ